MVAYGAGHAAKGLVGINGTPCFQQRHAEGIGFHLIHPYGVRLTVVNIMTADNDGIVVGYWQDVWIGTSLTNGFDMKHLTLTIVATNSIISIVVARNDDASVGQQRGIGEHTPVV